MRRLAPSRAFLPLLAALGGALAAASTSPPSGQAASLRDQAIAALENEQPGEAETLLRRLAELVPGDPLPHANLAVALLRQQRAPEATAAIEKALTLAPGRPDLLALRGDIELWGGDAAASAATYQQAGAKSADHPETWYGLIRAAQALGSPAGDPFLDRALDQLARLRPENAVVLLSRLRRAIERGDREVAAAAVLRLGELSYQFPEAAQRILGEVRDALERGELAAARVPAIRLENVTKILPLYQQSLRELSTGVLGLPVWRFVGEPEPTRFGPPIPISFAARPLVAGEARSAPGGPLAWGFFDADEQPDLARLVDGRLEIRLAAKGWRAEAGPLLRGATGLLAADLDDDANLDLLAFSPSAMLLARGDGAGGFADASAAFGLARTGASAAAVLDVDIEGDLDLAVGGAKPTVLRNDLSGPLLDVGGAMIAGEASRGAITALIATDLDRDGDLDLVAADQLGLLWLENLRQGRLEGRRVWQAVELRGLASGDLDGDGRPELVAVGQGGLTVLASSGRSSSLKLSRAASEPGLFRAVRLFDADNDGRLDIAVAGPDGVVVLASRGAGQLERVPIEGGPSDAVDLVAADLDADGDLDLVASSPAGLTRLDNRGGNRNRWLDVRLRGIDRGSGKNNRFGIGATIEVRSGRAYQFREVDGQLTHLGLGSQPQAEVLRVEWTNGVPQNRLAVDGRQSIVEEQVLKGSCPFLYAFDGERFAFVTDLLWGAPIGLPYAPGQYLPADPSELVAVPGLVADAGRYQLRLTEELWEAAFIDQVRLWVVDHPREVEVASALRMGVGPTPQTVLASRALRPLAAARDGRGEDVTARLASRDEVYASGFAPSRYQGVAAQPWSLEMELGESPTEALRLHLDAWIFPADASLNLAVAQRSDLSQSPPRLEVEVDGEWQPMEVAFGFPAGKTKTMVVDLPALPAGASRLRLVTTMWLAFDRIAWSTEPADDQVEVVARLSPERAELRFRGFSALVRRAPNAPHAYDYQSVTTVSPWLPFPGRYTRYGDVLELLDDADDRSVILAAGDEIALEFDAAALPPPPAGWVRSAFFETWGWDKDADRNTFEPDQLEPLPFRAMERYGDPLPEREELERWQTEWLTRVVESRGRARSDRLRPAAGRATTGPADRPAGAPSTR